MQRLVLDIQNKRYLENLLSLIEKSGLSQGVKAHKEEHTENLPVVPTDSTVNPSDPSGIWKSRNPTKELRRPGKVSKELQRLYKIIDKGADISSFGDIKEWQRMTRADRNINIERM